MDVCVWVVGWLEEEIERAKRYTPTDCQVYTYIDNSLIESLTKLMSDTPSSVGILHLVHWIPSFSIQVVYDGCM